MPAGWGQTEPLCLRLSSTTDTRRPPPRAGCALRTSVPFCVGADITQWCPGMGAGFLVGVSESEPVGHGGVPAGDPLFVLGMLVTVLLPAATSVVG